MAEASTPPTPPRRDPELGDFLSPQEAAEHLRISVGTLVRLIRSGGYRYVDLRPGAHHKPPFGRGRQSWGLTIAQVEAIKVGQTRRVPTAAELKEAIGAIGVRPNGHDGKRRLNI